MEIRDLLSTQMIYSQTGAPSAKINSIDARHRQMWREAMVRASDDSDSKLGTYIRVNPELKPFITPPNTLEGERTIITRFRTGSHSLAIELGRFSKVPRERRLCKCGNSVQTVMHVFNDCPLTVSFRVSVWLRWCL